MSSIVEKRFEYNGHPCVVIFRSLGLSCGFRCGYVGLHKDDPFYGIHHNSIDNIDCHGGLTYSKNSLFEQDDADIWWIGFDCGHSGDAYDYESIEKYFSDDSEIMTFMQVHKKIDSEYPISSDTIKDLNYCIEQCKSIVDQIEEVDDDDWPIMNEFSVTITKENRNMAEQYLKDYGISPLEAAPLLQGIGYLLLDKELYPDLGGKYDPNELP